MTWASRLMLAWCAVLVTACGAGDGRIDPGDLELRDVLGIAPEVAGAWDPDQRAAAREVIEAGLHASPAPPSRAALGEDPALDHRVARALASIDHDRARYHAGALGVVDLAVGAAGLVATPHAATLANRAMPPVEVQPRGWDEPALGGLPARGMEVLAALARDAGHPGGPLVVTPARRLAVVAAYLPATAAEPARLVVNPVVLAALEPPGGATVPRAQVAVTAAVPVAPVAAPRARPLASPRAAPPAGNAEGNPYSFYGSVAECAAAQRRRCDACQASASCTPITDQGDGAAECTQLAADGGRGYFLLCINLALAIDAVASCTAGDAPSCPRDPRASESIDSLEANARFLDDATCGGPLDGCLATLYGAPGGGFPGPGGDPGGSPPPRRTSIDCGDSYNGDSNCDVSPGCELDGPSCDDPANDGCSDSSESSGCEGSGGGPDAGGDSCSSDSEDSCGSQDNSACDSSDAGGGASDCGGGGESDCSGGGESDCGGGGGGGDCDSGGGGGDCHVAGTRGRGSPRLPIALAWALLPLPIARLVRRRAARRRARAECPEEAGAAEEVAS
ncbi:MAG TPA: hypothetical protein VFK02_04190 [Kofleriaceae bacterium]|nr:hypothetical protein [Kofleriaceae bacterium]